MQNNLSLIAKEGWTVLGYSIGAFILFVLLHCNILSYIAFAFILFFAFSYRNPERPNAILDENGVVAPIDGKILSIEQLHNNEEFAHKITIDSSYLDVSILRFPMSGKIKNFHYTKGTKLPYGDKYFNLLNENASFTIESEKGFVINVQHTLKESFDDLTLYIKEDNSLAISSRYGVLLNGITTLYLPHQFHIDVNVGSKIFASTTLLGRFK